MKKHLFVISFVLIFLLAVGAVSADDSYDLADESAISASEGDVDGQVDIDQSDDLSEDDKAPSVDVDDVTVNEGEIVSIPFNVTDSDTVVCHLDDGLAGIAKTNVHADLAIAWRELNTVVQQDVDGLRNTIMVELHK